MADQDDREDIGYLFDNLGYHPLEDEMTPVKVWEAANLFLFRALCRRLVAKGLLSDDEVAETVRNAAGEARQVSKDTAFERPGERIADHILRSCPSEWRP